MAVKNFQNSVINGTEIILTSRVKASNEQEREQDHGILADTAYEKRAG